MSERVTAFIRLVSWCALKAGASHRGHRVPATVRPLPEVSQGGADGPVSFTRRRTEIAAICLRPSSKRGRTAGRRSRRPDETGGVDIAAPLRDGPHQRSKTRFRSPRTTVYSDVQRHARTEGPGCRLPPSARKGTPRDVFFRPRQPDVDGDGSDTLHREY